MCDLNKIGSFLSAAALALIAAGVFFGIAAVAAGTFYGALGNGALMAAAAVSVGLALAAVNSAIALLSPCRAGRCAGAADAVFAALVTLASSLGVLLAAVIVGAFGASIPYAGTAVAIALTVGGLVAAGALFYVANALLPALDTCMSAPGTTTPVVTFFRVVGSIAGAVGLAAALVGGGMLTGSSVAGCPPGRAC
jgi:hypothetical protein